MRKLSDEGKKLIKAFEGCRLEAYLCSAGVPTIGWGHTATVHMGMKISQAQADFLFDRDIALFEKAVDILLKKDVSQSCFDAYVSLAYNIGVGALRASTTLKQLNAGDWKAASESFQWWNKAGGKALAGLSRRRASEVSHWLQGRGE